MNKYENLQFLKQNWNYKLEVIGRGGFKLYNYKLRDLGTVVCFINTRRS